MKKFALLITLIIGLTGCLKDKDQNYEEDIEGLVEEVKEESILVDSEGEVKGLVWISIDEDTIFLDDVSTEFKVGNYVKIKSTGEIRESYPMQADAEVVIYNKNS
ncbi:DUF3221 domain-containing protein [Mycoplasmatota bacterium]|nr:DUF3221 domain-containing protein [Mycoplasmatota bacterium]